MGVDDIVRAVIWLRSTALQMWIRQCLLAGGFEPECGNTEKPLAEHPGSMRNLPLIDNAAGRFTKRERSLMELLRARTVTEQIIGYCGLVAASATHSTLANPPICWQISAWSHCAPTTRPRAENRMDPTTPQCWQKR